MENGKLFTQNNSSEIIKKLCKYQPHFTDDTYYAQ